MNHIKNYLIGIGEELGIILLYFIVYAFSLLIFQNTQNNIYYTLSSILCDLILIIVFLFIFRKTIISKWDDYKTNYKKYLKETIIFYLIGFIIMFISLNLITIFYKMPSNEAANENLISTYPIYSIFNILITAPIVEELMTRVILKKHINNKVIYILLSCLIFAFLHIIASLLDGNIYELLYLIPYGSLGCIFSYIYLKTDNIWTNITYHSLHNLISLLIIFL